MRLRLKVNWVVLEMGLRQTDMVIISACVNRVNPLHTFPLFSLHSPSWRQPSMQYPI